MLLDDGDVTSSEGPDGEALHPIRSSVHVAHELFAERPELRIILEELLGQRISDHEQVKFVLLPSLTPRGEGPDHYEELDRERIGEGGQAVRSPVVLSRKDLRRALPTA
jgi:hypothetical protein